MKNYIWEDVPPVRFTKSGVNEFVTLKIVNVQKKTEHNRVYTVWTKVSYIISIYMHIYFIGKKH